MTKDEALKLALEALDKYGFAPCDKEEDWQGFKRAITAIKEALAQPPQEPVAWKNAALRVGEDLCSVGPFGYYDMTAEQWLDWALSVVTVHAPPAQRTWVGLTDDERNHARQTVTYSQLAMTASEWAEKVQIETERRLKEKNT